MRAKIIPIGNSYGIRIPKPYLKECGFDKEVEINIQGGGIMLTPVREARLGWDEAFKAMVKNDDNHLIIDDTIQHSWDDEEWEW
jgi:antitoxin MazE